MTGATLMFALIRGIILRPLPVPDEDRLVVPRLCRALGPGHAHPLFRPRMSKRSAASSRSFAHVAGVGYNGVFDQVWRRDSSLITARTVAVMGGFFDVAGVTAPRGRALRPEDDRSGAERSSSSRIRAWQRLSPARPKPSGGPCA